MLTLSVQQPWAYAMFHFGKNVENRTWTTNVRGPILIHAGKKIDKAGVRWMLYHGLKIPDNLFTGGIVGQVTLWDCVHQFILSYSNPKYKSLIENKFFFGPYGFLIKDQKELPFMPCPGKLGFFNIDYKFSLTNSGGLHESN